MWGVEHSLMVAGFGLFVVFELARFRVGAVRAIVAGVVTQVPFWIGSALWFAYQVRHPIEVNMVTDLAVSVLFVLLAHMTGKHFYALLALLFVGVGMASIWASIFGPFAIYTYLHEAAHYFALIIIAGRSYAPSYSRRIGRSLRAMVSR